MTEARIKIVPNPARQSVRIVNEKQSTVISYCITSISGEIVKRESLNDHRENEIDVSQLSSGIYFLDLFSADKRLIGSEKLVIP